MLTAMADDTAFHGFHRSGSGEPLVLLHGATSSWHDWLGVIPALEQEYDVLALTLPGHMASPWDPEVPYSLAGLVDQVEAILDRQGIDTAHLVGNSLGGWTAFELAARGRARSAMGISPAGGWDPSEVQLGDLFRAMRKNIEEAMPLAEALLADADMRRAMFSVIVERGDRITPEVGLRMWRAVLAVEDIDGAIAAVMGAGRTDLAEVTVPITIAWPEKDRLLPRRMGVGWETSAPTARWTELPGVGHVPMHDDPDLVAQAIVDALRG